LLSELKREFLKLLEEDLEFRYAVAGFIGLDEILKRLEKHDEKFNELLGRLDKHEQLFIEIFKRLDRHEEIFTDILERLDRHEAELAKLREDMIAGFKRHDEILAMHAQEIVKLRSDMVEGFKRHDEEIAKLRQDMMEGFKRHDEILAMHAQEIAGLRRDFRDMLSVVKRMEARLSRVERTLEKVTLDIEEEAREVLRSRLREMGYEVDLDILRLPMLEIDIYGVSRDLCVIGEATVRLGVRGLDRFIGKVERLEKLYPDKLKPKKVVLVYTCLATDEAVRKARERSIWILKALGDITPFTILEG
jgi:hypothetical protein